MILVVAFGAVSEIVLPLLFAAVLAVVFKPLVGYLERHGLKPTLGAGLIVLGLLALMVLVVVATVRGVIQQTDGIGDSVDAAIDKAVDELEVDEEAFEDAGRRQKRRPRRLPRASSRKWFRASTP